MINIILGKITGKVTTREFDFIVDKLVEEKAKKHEFVQVYHNEYAFVLCQITELIKDIEKTTASCNVIGYRDNETNSIRPIRTPFMPGTEVLLAEDEFIRSVFEADINKGAYVGNLEYRNIQINLSINKLVTKHVAILAKTGAGKSYTVGVLIEEMLDKGLPLLIIDPHGEYSALKEANSDPFELEKMESFGVKPKSYAVQVQEFGDITINNALKPLKLNDNFTPQELINLFPKLTSMQQAVLYTAIQDLETVNFENLTDKLRYVDNNAKFTILSVLDYLKRTNLFSLFPTDYNEIIKPGKASIINLKGIEPEIQQIIVYKLLKDLFDLRKQNKISPFLCIMEEAHNYIPEKHLGEAKSSQIIRTIASEGRKFGIGLCVVSQRPALIEKNVLSQCNTQIILKITNPNDLKAVTGSAEGLTYDAEDDIKDLPVGTAMITGFVEMPVFASIRPRKSRHGGAAIEIVRDMPEPKVLIEEIAEEANFDDEDKISKEEKVNIIKENVDLIEENIAESYLEQDNMQSQTAKLETQEHDEPDEPYEQEEYADEEQQYVQKSEKYVTLDEFQNISEPGSAETKLRLNRLEPEESKADEEQDVKTEEKQDADDLEEYQELLPLIKPRLTPKDIMLISPKPVNKINNLLVPAMLIRCKRSDREFKLLVELVDGRIVEDVDKFKTMNIIDIAKFSVAEIQVLETGLHMYTFTESMLTPKTGLSVTKVQNVLNLLYSDGVLDKKGEFYVVSHDATLISHPQDYAYNEELKYETIDFSEKKEKIKTIDEVKNKLAQFVDVVDVSECFIVKYEVVC